MRIYKPREWFMISLVLSFLSLIGILGIRIFADYSVAPNFSTFLKNETPNLHDFLLIIVLWLAIFFVCLVVAFDRYVID